MPIRTFLIMAAMMVTGCSTTSPAVPPGDAADEPPTETRDASAAAPIDAPTEATSADAEAGAYPDSDADAHAGLCTGLLSDVGASCAGTYAGELQTADMVKCQYRFSRESTGTCAGLVAVAYDFGTSARVCLYDGVDGGALVGAANEEDVNSFCNGSAYTIRAGNVPDSCFTNSYYASPLLTLIDASSPCPSDASVDVAREDASD